VRVLSLWLAGVKGPVMGQKVKRRSSTMLKALDFYVEDSVKV